MDMHRQNRTLICDNTYFSLSIGTKSKPCRCLHKTIVLRFLHSKWKIKFTVPLLPISSDQNLLGLGMVSSEISVKTIMPLKYSSLDKSTDFC